MAKRRTKEAVAGLQQVIPGLDQVTALQRNGQFVQAPVQYAEAHIPGNPQPFVGIAGENSQELPVGQKQIEDAYARLKEYKAGKSALEERVVNAEEWWKNNHWERFGSHSTNPNDAKPVSAWLFNSLINKHADFQDNYPCPAILPREESDEGTAKILSEVVPVILEQNKFAETYSLCSWDKPKTGTAIYGVFWNQDKENGLGDVDVKAQDIMNIYWEPGIKDIQESRDIFTTDLVDVDTLEQLYPEAQGKIKGTGELIKSEYIHEENIDTSKKIQVIDWYYKRRVHLETGGIRVVLHYCKFIPGTVLYASENDPKRAEEGWYAHGRYPFVFDVMFPEKDSPAGFGYLDVMVNPQEYIDKLDSVILRAASLSKPRYMASSGLNINAEEFADLSKDIVRVEGMIDETRLKQIVPPQLSDYVINMRTLKVEELKETSGNRDFSQGSTTSGVTAASAIAALQEAGSKLSRDMIKTSYTAHAEVVTLVVELIRQFYTLPRCYRITRPNGTAEYVTLDNSGLVQQQDAMMDQDIATRKPVFDIKISAQKASPYSRIANNELAKELFGMGVFNPQIADQAKAVISMMDFDRKDEVLQKIEENGTMYQKIQQLQQLVVQLAGMVSDFSGRPDLMEAVNAMVGQDNIAMTGINVNSRNVKTNSLGEAVNADQGTAGKARSRVQESTEVDGDRS